VTLYEVLLSLAILLGAIAVLGQLIATGSRAAMRARLQSQATLLCQSKLAEIVAGAEPLASVADVPFDATAPDWVWSLAVLPGPHEDLLQLEVTVLHTTADPSAEATATLSRYIRNPALYEEAATRAAEYGQTSETGE
jgi:hypothetical protein